MLGLLPISKPCAAGRAGIRTVYLLPCRAITGLTMTYQVVTAITLDCLQMDGGDWVVIEFESDTAAFTQTMQRQGRNVSVTQNLTFTEPLMSAQNRKALTLIALHCCLIAVVKDNTGRFHMMGVSVYGDDDYEVRDMQLQNISGTTGANSVSDSNEYVSTLSVTTNVFALTLSASPLTISTDCEGRTAFGPVAGGDTAFGPVAGGDTVFGY